MKGVAAAAAAVLATPEPFEKAMAARALALAWRQRRLAHSFDVRMPDRPARPERPALVAATAMPKRGRAGSPKTRFAMLHALAHIEFNAIDLAVDIAGRFGAGMPRAFVDDWLGVAADEAMHFALVARRLKSLGGSYGDLPAHDGLWQSAGDTADCVLARLAVVPMVLEARGLDVTPAMVARFEAAGDERSAAILRRILRDEVRHVAAGVRWFGFAARLQRFDPATEWQRLVGARFRGRIKPPFNDSARDEAGLTRDFYQPIAAV